ncbi:alternative ribosome rescue aminoacyl-tRNA hydrolase ArfB [Sphingorhabdus sp.]|jgi:ribosome-associated protein|uniref:alternative ribosome rescue aminoacyl-tRNA hydrolase ArfB n=1 Tax=Sphingorhabdus sp. TaxID=1902408 RepID=UPI000BDD6F2E|nr:alternative ribosome rescue aminoacyl-tRNA hydrolase ArfB [Sphingorhabdus sp.]MCE2729297.1 aminoacyl-tRNA hydrolase [Sphingomonadaceae bacterium]OYY16758.1 MAG: aminoacyl-tRNA hydrolase [Sphingomonadales bacterium 35-56-22]OYY98918.1 MAG: aminoacyl-tRNA hydrolase [Sphingomonadales bacterium 28-56-43]OYZ60387.1 MAG: aminoacyl-tRNA hydrolase [Sphingomonadales bacterium 24-56-14]OZA83270.1 MAG: aminoacyl-tRNA hydrolase [Sphingomonadales bacterium 39-57-19]
MAFDLPEDLLEETFLASTGPGGQNVNKVATACQLRVDVFALGLQPYAFRQLKILAGSKMTMNGELIVTARSHRTREANRADARARVIELIDRAHIRQARRVATKPSKAAKARRVDAKKGRSTVKKNRGKVSFD